MGWRCALLTGPSCPCLVKGSPAHQGPQPGLGLHTSSLLLPHMWYTCQMALSPTAAALGWVPPPHQLLTPYPPYPEPAPSCPHVQAVPPVTFSRCWSARCALLAPAGGCMSHEPRTSPQCISGPVPSPLVSDAASLPSSQPAPPESLAAPPTPHSTLLTPAAPSPRLPALSGSPHLPVVIPCPFSTPVSVMTEKPTPIGWNKEGLGQRSSFRRGFTWWFQHHQQASVCVSAGVRPGGLSQDSSPFCLVATWPSMPTPYSLSSTQLMIWMLAGNGVGRSPWCWHMAEAEAGAL